MFVIWPLSQCLLCLLTKWINRLAFHPFHFVLLSVNFVHTNFHAILKSSIVTFCWLFAQSLLYWKQSKKQKKRIRKKKKVKVKIKLEKFNKAFINRKLVGSFTSYWLFISFWIFLSLFLPKTIEKILTGF